MRGNCYDVTGSIRTTDAGAVGTEVVRLYCKLFASADPQPLERAFADAVRLYDGGDPAYLPCETEYHDIQHVLDVTLAMARLMDGYQSSSSVSDEALSPELYTVGILAALFHDFGYLRRRNDHRHRYGAEYTLTHVSRGAAFLRGYVRELGFSDTLAQLGGTLLHFTGYERPSASAQDLRGAWASSSVPRISSRRCRTAVISRNAAIDSIPSSCSARSGRRAERRDFPHSPPGLIWWQRRRLSMSTPCTGSTHRLAGLTTTPPVISAARISTSTPCAATPPMRRRAPQCCAVSRRIRSCRKYSPIRAISSASRIS